MVVSRKLSAATLAGIIMSLIAYILAKCGVELPADLVALIGTIVLAGAGYVTKESVTAVENMDLKGVEPEVTIDDEPQTTIIQAVVTEALDAHASVGRHTL